MADGSSITINTNEIHLFSCDHRGLRTIMRHEFGHYLHISDAYENENYYREPDAPKGSIMACEDPWWIFDCDPGWNITSYDLGIALGEYPNYERDEK